MRDTTWYEWDFETYEEYYCEFLKQYCADVVDHYFADELKDLEQFYKDGHDGDDKGCLVLVRNKGNKHNGVTDRTWAYVENRELPERFMNAFGHEETKVPQRFHKELDKLNKKIKENKC